MVLGSTIAPARLGDIPANFVVRCFVPQLKVLSRASVFLSHGGMNSVSESLYYGVPVIVLSQFADQLWVAKRIAQLGAGINVGKPTTPATLLRQAVDRVQAIPTYRQSAQQIGATLRAAGGYERAATIIEQVLQTQSEFIPPARGTWSMQLMNWLTR